jgi:hypothetical protein
MEDTEFYGVKSLLSNVYESTISNNYYAQVTPSAAMKKISRDEDFVGIFSATKKDTIRVPKDNLRSSLMAGDLRLYGTYSTRTVNRDETSDYSKELQTIDKLLSYIVPLYRKQYVYLLYAEALNRAGFPHSAFAVLKYGLRNEENLKRIPASELIPAAELINFPNDAFTENNTIGIHSRGCGDSKCDTLYRIEPTLTATTDTIQMVEDLIVNEMALETAFEGLRYYTLMRIAMRRNDNSFLAEPISRREGEMNMERFNKLMNRDNWYLPINTK